MPKVVDAAERSAEIIDAAMKILSEGGFVKLTLSNLAKELGGSMRLVTHYYRDRPALIDGILEKMALETDVVVSEIEALETTDAKVIHALQWFVLPDAESVRDEKVRIALLVHKDVEPAIARFFEAVDLRMRALLRTALTDAVPTARMEDTIDFLRVVTSGLALNVVEHAENWPAAKQWGVVEACLHQLRLLDAPSPSGIA
ncbi:TetR/AcrR family transcriptional regulator [Microbacterium sp. F51-2R]|uniref:TetR/AcrR family transcriptional regulator n=1 Tax=Microbacterium sp. F51-2R TaxID=3445777 RepID=UPI003FA01702